MLNHTLPPFRDIEDLYQCRWGTSAVPKFRLPVNGTINEQIYQTLEYLNSLNNSIANANLKLLPDGAVTFYKASADNLTVKLQIDDIRLMGYHR